MPDLARDGSRSRGGTSRPISSSAAAASSRSSRASGSRRDVAVVDGYVAGLGDYEGAETLDASGRYVVPGFIDAHMHLESSKLLVDEFARLVLPLGTTAVVADPHEIANVLGTDGVHWLLDVCGGSARRLLHGLVVRARVERSSRRGARCSPGDLEALLRRRRVLGLAEMMNFPGVDRRRPARAGKLAARRRARRRARAGRARQRR